MPAFLLKAGALALACAGTVAAHSHPSSNGTHYTNTSTVASPTIYSSVPLETSIYYMVKIGTVTECPTKMGSCSIGATTTSTITLHTTIGPVSKDTATLSCNIPPKTHAPVVPTGEIVPACRGGVGSPMCPYRNTTSVVSRPIFSSSSSIIRNSSSLKVEEIPITFVSSCVGEGCTGVAKPTSFVPAPTIPAPTTLADNGVLPAPASTLNLGYVSMPTGVSLGKMPANMPTGAASAITEGSSALVFLSGLVVVLAM
ncbi:hypothetical protein HYALB_00004039 [Hymenoscyphus albidus]|uniref:GPI anchored serine-rich protein n=1 Tax=Hymenoscyphus albidus TaxID=595503 RepID=A0A9N9M4Z9_9HELO|nr:hypothetical protein HYALB_00004039 [Hymenoscyphus albidus]